MQRTKDSERSVKVPPLAARLQKLIPLLAIATFALFSFGLLGALVWSPEEKIQGQVVRILYIHVPCAWMALFVYAFMSVLSFLFLTLRWPLLRPLIQASIPIGAAFSFLALLTGSLWGRPTWGAWWVWDARLTSMLILLLIYMGAGSLQRALGEGLQATQATCLFILVGALNLPVIHFSVQWWHTLHQGASILRLGAPTIAGPMLRTLLIMALAHLCLFGLLLSLRLYMDLLARRMSRCT